MKIQKFKYLFTLSILLFCAMSSDAQYMEYVGKVMPEEEVEFHQSTKDNNGNVYVLTNNYRSKLSTIQKYNGSFWTNTKPTPLIENFGSLEYLNGELLVADQKFQIGTTIRRWDGTDWYEDSCSYSGLKTSDTSITLVKHNGKVYFFASAFSTINGVKHDGSAEYDGTQWKKTPISYPKYVYDGMSQFDTLYLLGASTDQGNTYLYKYFRDVLIDSVRNINFIKSTHNYFFYGQNNLIFLNDGTKTIVLNDSLKTSGLQQIFDVDEWNTDIILYGRLAAGFSGFYSTTNDRFFVYNGSRRPRIHATKYGNFASFVVDPINQFYTLGKIHWKVGQIKGKMFLDLDNNCSFGATDQVLANKAISFGDFHTLTDENGNYSLYLAPGLSDTLKFEHADFDSIICPIVLDINTVLDSTVDLNLPLNTFKNVDDLAVGVEGGIVRHGQKTTYQVIVKNNGSQTSTPKSLSVEFDSRLTTFESGFSHTLNGNVVTFIVPPIEREKAAIFTYSLYVDENQLNLGDSIETYLAVTKDNDRDSSDNVDTLKQFVISAYDPNLKKCLPYGEVNKKMDLIEYTIRFQNTGTDTAFRVIVVDTLERNLPIEKVQVIGLSHFNYKINVIGNTVIWTFDDILLPDSGTNFIESQGFIKFKVKLKRDLEIGDSIRNRAHIYFDYQSPITTNYARVLRVEETQDSVVENEVKVMVYPNPAQEYIDVSNKDTMDIQFALFDITGRIVMEQLVLSGEVKRIQIDHLSTGIYIMRREEGCLGKLLKSK